MPRARVNPETGLTEKREHFCLLFVTGNGELRGNASACVRAVFNMAKAKPTTINRRAKELLDNSHIQARISALRASAAERAEIKDADIIRETARLGISDIRRLIGENGEILPPAQWPDDAAAAVSALEVIEEQSEDGSVRRRYKVKLWDKNPALEKLMKHRGLFKDASANAPKLAQININLGPVDRR